MSDPLTLTLRDVSVEMSLGEWEEVGRTVMVHVLERDRRVEEAQRAADGRLVESDFGIAVDPDAADG